SDNVVRQENLETASTVKSIIPASTVNSNHNSTVIITQNNKPEPISSELINLDISNTLQTAKNLANITEGQGSVYDFQINELCHSEADNTILPSNRADNTTRSLSGHIQSQAEGLKQFIAAQRVPDPCRSLEKLHEFLPDCEKTPEPSQHLQVTQWMASIDGKEEHDSFDSSMEEKQPSTTQEISKNSPSSQQQQFQCEKSSHKLKTRAKARNQPQNLTARATGSQNIQQEAMENVFQMARKMRKPD
ncbi:hypothetical protein O181_097839, partial [Austropuccinia psidii MF-1]|nr:hypothetical protein [Austropuccinia psidii MF-1]